MRNVRIRIPIVFVIILTVFPLFAQKKLVVGKGAGWSTSFLAQSNSDDDVEVTIADIIGAGWGVTLDLPAGGAVIARNVGESFANESVAFLAPSPDAIDVVSLLSFNDGITRASFALPPIGSVTQAVSANVGPLVSDSEEIATITTFSESDVPLYVMLTDGSTGDRTVESFTSGVGVSQYRIQSQGVYLATVHVGYYGFGCHSRCEGAEVYGFASTGSPDGGSFRSFSF